MRENLKEYELEFILGMHDPICVKECLFPENLKNPSSWANEDCKLVKIRNYQMAWQPYHWMLCDDTRLKQEENLKKKILTGTCYNLGGRASGKSFDFIQMDIPINSIHTPGDETCLGSATAGFLKKVASPIINTMREHPFFAIFKKQGKSEGIVAGNDMEVQSRNGSVIIGRNEKIDSPEPGVRFQGLHYKTFYYEESSYQTEAGEQKRVDSGSPLGVINRFSGIPDIRIGSPLGKILYNEDNKKYVCRLPQSVRADWNDELRKQKADEYNGESSLAYKLNVLGEIVEGAEGYWDIQRIRKHCLNKDRKIKHFDIDKKRFKNFKQYLVIDRLPAEQIYVCADIGAGARPTEIIIIFYNGKKYQYIYNISLNKLSSQEQAEIFAHIYNKLGSCFIGIDATTDYGIVERLKKDYSFINPAHIFGIDLRKNIDYDFEKNKNTGRILRNNDGSPVLKKMVGIDFAMQQLEYLFYEGHIDIPLDNKFFKEFSDFIVLQSGLRKKYDTSSTDDLHQAFQIFAITRWNYEWETLRNQNNTDTNTCLGTM